MPTTTWPNSAQNHLIFCPRFFFFFGKNQLTRKTRMAPGEKVTRLQTESEQNERVHPLPVLPIPPSTAFHCARMCAMESSWRLILLGLVMASSKGVWCMLLFRMPTITPL